MKTLKIGIAGYNRMKARTMAIARGEHKPARGEPTVWFTSIESFAKVLWDCGREARVEWAGARETPRPPALGCVPAPTSVPKPPARCERRGA